jgi:hypothetical protein
MTKNLRYDEIVKLSNEGETYVPEGSPRHKYDKANKGKPAQLLIKLVGDKHSTDYFALEDPSPGLNDSDNFVKIYRDIGIVSCFFLQIIKTTYFVINFYLKLNNVHLKYLSNDKRKVFIESIEIINPKGENYRYFKHSQKYKNENL